MVLRFLPALLALLAVNVHAATLVEVKTPQGLTRVYNEGSRSRMSLDKRRYVIVDSKTETLFIVDPDQQRVMDMSDTLKAAPQTSPNTPNISFEKQGSGPRIAGYRTTRYQYLVDNKPCGTLLASKQALQDTGLQHAFRLLQRMAARADAMMPNNRSGNGECLRTGNRFPAHVEKLGIPMRIDAQDGKAISEILRIENNAKLPPNAFSIPAGYQTQKAGRATGDTQQQRRIREAGKIPPEILRQLQQMQKP